LSGTPGAGTGGIYRISFTAHNGTSPASVQDFALTIDQPPTFTSDPSGTFKVGSADRFAITTSGFPAPKLTEAGALPKGVTFLDNGNGTATLAGDPQADAIGIYKLTIDAENGVSDPTQLFTLTIERAAPSSTTTTTTTTATPTTQATPTGASTTAVPTSSTAPITAGPLAVTGTNTWTWSWIGLSLFAVGVLTVQASRRRRR
jgi:hypothetical protein